MAAQFPAGTVVKQICPLPIEGVVERFVFDEVSGDIHVIITDADGQTHSFNESEVEEA